jgi:group I intron endonuclease
VPNVYKITNTLNGKLYIGYTSSSIENRWSRHKYDAERCTNVYRKFYNAIKKYDEDVWLIELLCVTKTIQEAKEKEIEYIQLFDSYNKGYNSTKGGDGNNGMLITEESKLKRSKALVGRKKAASTIEKFKLRIQTDLTKSLISKAHIGKKKPWVKWDKNQITKRAMTRRALTKEQFKEIHNLNKQGYKITEIAHKVNCSYDLVKKWLKRSWDL